MNATDLLEGILLNLGTATDAATKGDFRKMHKYIRAAYALSQELDNRMSGMEPPKNDPSPTLRPRN